MLAGAFSKSGHEIHVVTWSSDHSNKDFSYVVVRNPSIIRLLYEHSWADVIFENNICLRLAWPRIFLRKASLIALHTWINRADGSLGWQDRMKLKWLSKAGQVVACSNAIKERCWPDSIVIGNSYQDEMFKELHGVERNADFIFLGRLVSDKGAELAIQAFYNLLHKGDIADSNDLNLNLTIVGDGPERKDLHRMVKSLCLEDIVIFKGALQGKELVQCLNQHRYLVVPSLWEEPFGIVALEGMACGCLPIVSDGGGLPEAVGNAGIVFRRGDVNDLTRCMERVVKEPRLREKCYKEMHSHLKSHYLGEISKRYLSIIEKLN